MQANNSSGANIINYQEPSGWLAQTDLYLAPKPGATGATTYRFQSGAYANSEFSLSDVTDATTLFHYNPATKWEFLQKVKMSPDSTFSGLNVGSLAGNPSSPSNGDIWYNSAAGLFECRQAGLTVPCIYSGGLTAKTNGTNNTSQSIAGAIQGTDTKSL